MRSGIAASFSGVWRSALEAVRAQPLLTAILSVAAGAVLATALLFAHTAAGAVAGLILLGLLGAGVVAAREQLGLSRPWSERRRTVAAILLTFVVSCLIYGPSILRGRGGMYLDWGSHHVIVKEMADGFRQGFFPNWTHLVLTGEVINDLYPAFTYALAAVITILFRADAHIPAIMGLLAWAGHTGIAIGVTRLARRFAPWPLAALFGILALMDKGAPVSGAAQGNIYLALFHQAIGEALLVAALVAVVDALEAPRLRRSVAIWLLTALAIISHPLMLIFTIGLIPALAVVAIFARDVRFHRVALVAGDVVVGLLIASAVWLPLSDRLLYYGQHYGSEALPLWKVASMVLDSNLPKVSWQVVLGACYAGILAALVSRRGGLLLLASASILFLFGYTDAPWVLLELVPSASVARFAAQRLMGLARPMVFALGAYGVWLLLQAARPSLAARTRWERYAVGAGVAMCGLFLVRGLIPPIDEHVGSLRSSYNAGLPDPQGFNRLVTWATEQARLQTPEKFGRLLFQGGNSYQDNYRYHLAARSGLPVIQLGYWAGLVTRERLEREDAASLKRFNVRWVVRRHESPSIGDPATERVFGSYRLRELPDWDARFARIEKGTGQVVTTAIRPEKIVLELSGTTEPALVSLGMGYYPRWRAFVDGREVPVYAIQPDSKQNMRIPALWMSPGRATLTFDGATRSDRAGYLPSILGFGMAIGIAGLHRRPFLVRRVIRPSRRLAHRLEGRRRELLAAGAALGGVLLLAAGIWTSTRTVRSFTPSIGFFPDAVVEGRRPGKPWKRCTYVFLSGYYECPGVGRVGGGVSVALEGLPASWPYVVPTTMAYPSSERTASHFRITLIRRAAGRYRLGIWGRGAQGIIEAGGLSERVSGRRDHTITLSGEGKTKLVIEMQTSEGEGAGVAVVREDVLDIDRNTDVPWAPQAPP